MSWQEVRLDDIVSMKYGKLPPKEILPEGAFPVFSGYRITGFCKEYIYEQPEVVVVARGVGGTGDVKISPQKSWITNLSIVLSINEELIDKKFLFYRLGIEPLKDRLNTGAAQAQITIEKLAPYQITIPNKLEQKRIADILSAYDDLIENNQRRIALLEEAARLLYREWFVHFRFPGHEHVKITDGLPEGWKHRTFGEIADLKYGKALKQENRIEGPFPVFGSSGIVGTHQTALVEGPTIVIGRKGNVGSIFWSPIDFWPIDTVYFIPKEQVDFWLYLALPFAGFQNTDAGVPGLNRDFAYSRKLVQPSTKLRILFNETVEPMLAQRTILETYIQKLAQARDLLLPRLMNGEIKV